MKKYVYLGVLKPDTDLLVIANEIKGFSLLKYYESVLVVKFALDHQILKNEEQLFKSVELEQMFHAVEEE